jgi:hypothetical protein
VADNLELNAGSGGATLATDDVGGVHYQLVKLAYGALDAATVVDTTDRLPVSATQSGTWNIGTVTAVTAISNALPAGTNNIGDVDVLSLPALAAGTNNIGDVDIASIAAGDNNIGNVDIVTVPTDPFGANADAASATGSISAKLRFIAATGIPITGAALTALQLIDDTIIADDAAFTVGTTKVSVAGYIVDETATDSADEGDAVAARATADRKQIVTNYAHATAGGATPYYNLDVDETEDEIKASAGKLFWIHVMNLSASVRYIKFYNATAANVTVGTTTPVLSFPVPTMADTNGAGFTIHFGDIGVQFSTAITVAATTGLADNSTGAPGANEVVLNAGYLWCSGFSTWASPRAGPQPPHQPPSMPRQRRQAQALSASATTSRSTATTSP